MSVPNQPTPPGHFSPEMLSGYIDRSLPATARAAVDTHLAECAECRAELVAAKRLVNSAPSTGWRLRPAAAVAAIAATILVAVLLRPSTTPPDRMRSAPSSVAVARNALTAVTPMDTAAAAASNGRFVWTRGESVIEYTLTLLEADGRTRWSGSTSDTSLTLPDSVVLVPGSTIYWYVDGLQADGRSVGTGRQRLTVR